MAVTPMQQRSDTSANWTSVNPVLRTGEIGFETDTGLFKIGDGAASYASLPYANSGGGSGTGTVTSISVADANGFNATIATPSTTPVITLETTITGLLKGNGTAVSAATAGTDYATPASVTAAQAASVSVDGDAMDGYLAPKVVPLTDGATIDVDAASGNDFYVTLAGDRTMAAPTNPADGQCITFEITQDSTGSRTVSWTSGTGGYSFGSGSAPVLSTTAGDTDLVAFRYSARVQAWLYLGSGLGY